jgi:AAA family ATP:ADP antiporter
VRRVVDIRRGELRTTLHLAALLAVLIAGHTVAETARDALFLSRLPPQRLTVVYALLAVLSLAAGTASSVLAARFGRRVALVLSLVSCACFAVLIFFRPMTPMTVFVLYVGSGIIGTVLTLQFWMLAGPLFTVAQGKRLFGPIAAGGVMGAATGAGVAVVALRVAPTAALLLVVAFLFVAAAALAAGVPAGDADEPSGRPSPRPSWARDLVALRKDRFLLFVAAMTVFGTAATLVADYLFKSTASREIAREGLGSFFATFYAAQNGLALVVQVFVTGALVRRLGVTRALLVLPLLLGVAGLWGALGGGAIAVLAAKGADGSLRHSLHRVSSELVLLPVRADLRDRAKPVIETLCTRGTQAVVAAGLALLPMHLATGTTLSAVMLVLSLAWLGMVLLIRAPYIDLFRRAIARGELPGGAADDLDVASIETIMEALASQDEEIVLAAIDVLHESGRARVLPALILHHRSARVLERALAIVATPDRRDWIPLAKQLVDHEDASVRANTLRALAAIGEEPAVARGLQDRDDRVRACAAFFLASRRSSRAPLDDADIGALIARPGEEGARGRAALLEVVADFGHAAWLPVVEAIVDGGDARPGLAPLAAAAIQKTGDERFLPFLVSHLNVRDGRAVVRDTVVALGPPAFRALVTALEDSSTAPRVRWEIPRALASFGTQAAVDYLTSQLRAENSGTVRFRILRALERVRTVETEGGQRRPRFERSVFEQEAHKNLVEHLRLVGITAVLGRVDDHPRAERTAVGKLLYHLLCDKRRQSLDRAFRALQLAHSNEDLTDVYAALVRGDRRARANALELIDMLKIGLRETKALFSLIADDLQPADLLGRARAALASSPTDASRIEAHADHDRAIGRLLHDSDDFVAALAAHHALDCGVIALARQARGALDTRPSLGTLFPMREPAQRGSSHGR